MKYRYMLAGVAMSFLIAGPGFAKSDKSFLRDAIKGDNSEIALGKLAAQKGASEGVRGFGTTLATDHTKAKEDATAVATSMKIDVSDEMMPEARKEMKKLDKM